MAQSNPVERVAAIDGLRGIASLLVILVHTSFNLGADYRVPLVQPYFYAGQTGVTLFFVISAFCLYGTFSKLTTQQPRTAVISFWIKRSLRILPLWWLWVIVYGLWRGHTLRNGLASAFFYWGFWRYGKFMDVFPGGWSLFVEETFYWLFPLIFPAFRSLSRTIIGVAIAWTTSLMWERYAAHAGIPNDHDYIFNSPVNHWYCFFLGMACYQVTKSVVWQPFVKWIAKNNLAATAATVALAIEWPTSNQRATALLFAGIILIAMAPGTWLCRLMSIQALRWYGKRCYSIYLCHFFVLEYFADKTIIPWSAALHIPKFVEVRMLCFFPVVVLACAVAGDVTFRWIEMPTIALANKLSGLLARIGPSARTGDAT